MSEGKIFLKPTSGDRLIEMNESGYHTEDDLQALIANNPDLLPGDQISPNQPRRWLLVAREMGVPDKLHAANRWSLDHLFLDQDGIPTFVECKRAEDTRGRREVVAQMLDYAANGLAYWNLGHIQTAAEQSAAAANQTLEELIAELIDAPEGLDEYWDRVEQNLKQGRVRLIFASNEIPVELRRLVEFLNEKLNDIEVYAVEIKQFLGQQQQVIVPRVLGMTEKARMQKEPGSALPTLTWEAFKEYVPASSADFYVWLLDECSKQGFRINWGKKYFVGRTYFEAAQREASFLYGSIDDEVQFYSGHYLGDVSGIDELRQKVIDTGLFTGTDKTLRAFPSKCDHGELRRAVLMIFEEIKKVG